MSYQNVLIHLKRGYAPFCGHASYHITLYHLMYANVLYESPFYHVFDISIKFQVMLVNH